MKVTEHIKKAKKTLFSFEILPPLKGTSIQSIYDSLDPLMEFNPPFIDVTYHREEVVYKKRENEWLSGQYEIPTFVLSSEDQTLTQYPPIKFFEHDLLPEYKTLITKYKITNKVMIVNEVEMRQLNIDVSQFELRRPDSKSNLSTATLKALKIFT